MIANYYFNKEYITLNFCENKAKPQLNCHGKCHLKKELAKEDEKEQKLPFQNIKDKTEVQFFSALHFNFAFCIQVIAIKKVDHQSLLLPAHTHPVFHPPTC